MNYNTQGYQVYKKNQYETASPHKLISMLYEGVIRFSNQAIRMIEINDIINTNDALKRTQDILYELISCLNFDEGKEIAQNLNALYLYLITLYEKANIEKNTQYIYEAINIIKELKLVWDQIGRESTLSYG